MSPVPASPKFPQSLDCEYTERAADADKITTLQDLVTHLRREQVKTQDLLSSLSFSLRSFNNLNQFLALIPLIVSRVTDVDAAALILFRPNGQVSLEQLYCHEGQQCRNIRLALETVTRQLSLVSASGINLSQAIEKQLGHQLVSDYRWFSTAILVRNVELHERGRLYLFSNNPTYIWTETRQKLAQLVADQTAVAIENDALTTQLRKQERISRELEIGAEIQARLLPSFSPKIEGVALASTCQAANQVGGDYYDFIPIYNQVPSPRQYRLNQANRWGLVIGDVMGKGVPAGLIMTMTRGILRADALHHHSPAEILKNLNQVMYADLENSSRFVTLFYSEYDPKTRKLAYSNAAHNPPLLWRSRLNEIERLDTDGMLIGLDPNTQYQEDEVTLDPGDTIIFYTDGFTDATNSNGDRFDEENLIRNFQEACHLFKDPQAILDHLFERLRAFMGKHNHGADDMTLIVLQIQPMLLTL
ncbi:MAG: PP2C family protein-serine/threonine phosphatase [Acaryochloridaceae cyanobacterium SU_2_1]|nr:PP2C family protein-serine/threonine phosphatase [Acaryochloridaceae cyanobacterium SU_2_1]